MVDAAFKVDDDMSSYAMGRQLVGLNVIIGGWLGRALEDARIMQHGGDPERPSERAMRESQQEGGE
jgi:hypothetical protein